MLLTKGDLKYLQAMFYLGGSDNTVSPTMLSRQLKVTKVSTYQKMKRLERLGFGTYVRQKGFKLNKKSIENIERSIFQHHVLEHFFTKTLGISCSEACNESAQIAPDLSDDFVNMMYHKLGEPLNCRCGCRISPPYKLNKLKSCTWCQQSFGTQG